LIQVRANRETCEGFGNCVRTAASIFALDDEGVVVVIHELVPRDKLGELRRAAYDCPTDSISFIDQGGGE
jgi:ferredoxin